MAKFFRFICMILVAVVSLPAASQSGARKYVGKPVIDFSVVHATADSNEREKLYSRLEAMRDVVFTLTLSNDKTFSSLSVGGPDKERIQAKGTWTVNGNVIPISIFETNGKKRKYPKTIDWIQGDGGETLHLKSPYGGK